MNDDITTMRRRTFLALMGAAAIVPAIGPAQALASTEGVPRPIDDDPAPEMWGRVDGGSWKKLGGLESATTHRAALDVSTVLSGGSREYLPIDDHYMNAVLSEPEYGDAEEVFSCSPADLLIQIGQHTFVPKRHWVMSYRTYIHPVDKLPRIEMNSEFGSMEVHIGLSPPMFE